MRYLIIASVLIFFSLSQAQSEFQALAGPFVVSRVIDAKTLELSAGDQTSEVKLLGIATPKKGDEAACALYGSQALDFTSDLLLEKEVWLEFDLFEADDPSIMLAYVYLANDQGNWHYDPQQFVQINEQLLLNGLAEPMFDTPIMRYEDQFLLAMQKAKNNGLGIWAEPDAINLNCMQP